MARHGDRVFGWEIPTITNEEADRHGSFPTNVFGGKRTITNFFILCGLITESNPSIFSSSVM
jgi:hypothetical protein